MSDDSVKVLVFVCPWCDMLFQVLASEMNCGIFRHGVDKKTGIPLSPHAREHEVKTQEIWGCGKPIRYDISQQAMLQASWDS